LKSPKGLGTRPTLGRVREAIFSILAPVTEGARVLDLFAGAGALGFEALSRGARSCLFIDASRRHVDLIRENARLLGCEDRVECRKAPLPAALRHECPANDAYDLVLMDPPYEKGLAEPTLQALIAYQWLSSEAIVVVETRRNESLAVPESVQLLKDKQYGDTRVRFIHTTHIET